MNINLIELAASLALIAALSGCATGPGAETTVPIAIPLGDAGYGSAVVTFEGNGARIDGGIATRYGYIPLGLGLY